LLDFAHPAAHGGVHAGYDLAGHQVNKLLFRVEGWGCHVISQAAQYSGCFLPMKTLLLAGRCKK
jgi:hypothetical protein